MSETMEARLAAVEREIRVMTLAFERSGNPRVLLEARAAIELAERDVALRSIGGRLRVADRSKAGPDLMFDVGVRRGVSAIVHRPSEGGELPTDDTVEHPFESVAEAVGFVELGRDVALELMDANPADADVGTGARAPRRREFTTLRVPLAHVVALEFTPATATNA